MGEEFKATDDDTLKKYSELCEDVKNLSKEIKNLHEFNRSLLEVTLNEQHEKSELNRILSSKLDRMISVLSEIKSLSSDIDVNTWNTDVHAEKISKSVNFDKNR